MSLKKLGRYEIVRPLGQGAMGLVYEAHDPNINRGVAIKTIRVDQLAQDMAAEFESRFRCETQAGGRLQHPNIIGVYDAGNDQGLAFMVMELVRGGDLRQQLDPGRSLSFERSMGLMKELLSALNFAHEQGVIHRDIKPANLMLDLRGRVKLGDFGVAQITAVALDGAVERAQSVRTDGATVGTLKYLSPEQVGGLQVDARADLFAAGVVLYQLLTGAKPFEGDSDYAVMQAIAQRDPIRPSSLNLDLPNGIDAVVFKALAKCRDDRYASARDFALALRAVMQQAATRAGAGAGAEKVRDGRYVSSIPTVGATEADDDATRLLRPVEPNADPVFAAARAAQVLLVAPTLARINEQAELAWIEAQNAQHARQATRVRDAAAAAEDAAGFEAQGVAVLAQDLPARMSPARAGAHPKPRGHALGIAVAASVTLLGGCIWFVAYDTGTPPRALTRASRPAVTAARAPSPVAALVPVAVPAPIVASALLIPLAVEPTAPSPVATGATLAQASALERRDLKVALDAYAKIATGTDKKSAAEAARRLWALYRDGTNGLAANPQQAQRWYDRAKQAGAKLPLWTVKPPVQPQASTVPAALPAAPVVSRIAPPSTTTALPPALTALAAAPSPAPAVARDAGPGTPLAAALATPLTAATVAVRPSTSELFERGQSLEGTSLRQAEGAYREAAQQGHGASQKRLWELLLKAGRTSEAVRYQKDAWDQKVPGVPEPKSAIRL